MTDLNELAARVEALDGPDRALDKRIAITLKLPWDYAADWGPRGNYQPVAFPYTASLDAAMTLVPEHSVWHVSGGSRRGGYAVIESGDDKVPDFKSAASTPALAICAAALRAKAASHD